MAKFINKDVSVTVNSVDLSDHVQQVETTDSSPTVDVTAMGANNTQNLLGIGDATIAVTFFQDFEAASVNATLSPLAGVNEPFTVVVKPTSAAVSASNPSYSMEAVLPEYKALSGAVGTASTVEITFQNAGEDGIVESTGSGS